MNETDLVIIKARQLAMKNVYIPKSIRHLIVNDEIESSYEINTKEVSSDSDLISEEDLDLNN